MLENLGLLIILQKEFASSFFPSILKCIPIRSIMLWLFKAKKSAKLVQLITDCSWLPPNQIIFNLAFLLERRLCSCPKIVGPLPNYDTCRDNWAPSSITQWGIMELAPTQPKHPLWDDTLTLEDKGRACNRYHVIWIIISDNTILLEPLLIRRTEKSMQNWKYLISSTLHGVKNKCI